MPQFRQRTPSAHDPEEQRVRALAVIAKGLEETQVRPGARAEIIVGAYIVVPHEDNGQRKYRRPRRNAPDSVVSTLLACHANGDYAAALAEIDRFLGAHYIPGCQTVVLDEFSMQPIS